MKKRLLRIVKRDSVVLAIGIAYAVFVLCTGIGIPCPFYAITKLKCPGCGISRMLLSLLKLDFAAAFHYNPFLLITLPIVLFCFIYSDVKYILTGNGDLGKLKIILWIEIALALLFGVLRNIF